MSNLKPRRVHPTAEVHPDAKIGDGSSIWNWAQVRENVTIGADCIISKGVYVDAGVVIGRACKVQNNVSLFNGVQLEDGVFIGPHVCFTNDMLPRAVEPDGSPKGAADWSFQKHVFAQGRQLGRTLQSVVGLRLENGVWLQQVLS